MPECEPVNLRKRVAVPLTLLYVPTLCNTFTEFYAPWSGALGWVLMHRSVSIARRHDFWLMLGAIFPRAEAAGSLIQTTGFKNIRRGTTFL